MAQIEHLEGYVAYLDILGFSKLIESNDFEHIFEQYSNIIDNAVKPDSSSSR